MIAADTSTWVAYLEGSTERDVAVLDKALSELQILMIPVVLTELLSDQKLPPQLASRLAAVPLIELQHRFWQRAGTLRSRVLAKGRRARFADALIAQTCLDARLSLITRDRDFQAFAQIAGLQLIV